jgi:hypothetical protein
MKFSVNFFSVFATLIYCDLLKSIDLINLTNACKYFAIRSLLVVDQVPPLAWIWFFIISLGMSRISQSYIRCFDYWAPPLPWPDHRMLPDLIILITLVCRYKRPRSLRHRSAIARLLRLWVRIPKGTWKAVCCECCVVSGWGLCDGLVTRPEESYWLWCVVDYDLETP